MTTPPFHALSLDLWFTTLFFERRSMETWRRARTRVLEEVLELPGGPPSSGQLERVTRQVRRAHQQDGAWRETLDPADLVAAIAQGLGGRLRVSAEEAGARYSEAGLEEGRPRVNPEAVEVASELSQRGIAVIAITNTGRREESWRRFFERGPGPAFRTIVTSCEVGRGKPSPEIFLEGARRLGLSPTEILHVGDRWDIDVRGARAAGAGRALYSGLWDLYPEDGEDDRESNLREDDGAPDVLRIGSLRELLTRPGLFEPSAGSGSPGPPG